MAQVCFILRYFPPFFSSKRNQILLAECKKGFATACKSAKNPQKVYCMPAACIRAADFLRSYCKGNKIHFPATVIACRIRELYEKAIMLAKNRWDNLITNWRRVWNILFTIRSFYTHEGLSSHTTFRPICCDGTVPLIHFYIFCTKIMIQYLRCKNE